MAKIVVQNPSITLGTTTISANVAQVTIALEADDVETTSFASGGFRERIGGLKSGTVSFDFHNDYAAGALDSQLFPILGSTVAVKVGPTGTAAASGTTPVYEFTALCTEISPIDSAVGDLASQSVSWPITGAVTRNVGTA